MALCQRQAGSANHNPKHPLTKNLSYVWQGGAAGGGVAAEAARLCSTPGCGKAATMACPKCIQLNLPISLFCSQVGDDDDDDDANDNDGDGGG
jgi:hypothetical protein